jgi:tripartite-type tricarboxylate transporter receptor subunit TctC
MKSSKFRVFLACMLSLWIGAHAQTTYPHQPIQVVVPFPPGGLTENTSRMLAQLLSQSLGQAVETPNYTGNKGQAGMQKVIQSAPDGYTLLAVTVTHAANASLMPGTHKKLLNDLTGVAFLTSAPTVVVVRNNSPIHSLQDLALKAKNREVQGGTAGTGSTPHLAQSLFQDVADVSITPIPYDGGKLAIQALLQGEVDVVFSNIPHSLEHLQSGQLRALAITAPHRHPAIPLVPTSAEVGYPELLCENWGALMAPQGTPPEILRKLSNALSTIANEPKILDMATGKGLSIRFIPWEHFGKRLHDEVTKWQGLIQKHHITPGWVE